MTELDHSQDGRDIGISMLAEGIALFTIDLPGRAQNLLTPGLCAALAAALDRLQNDPDLRGAVLVSGKAGGFLAGADLVDLQARIEAGWSAEEAADWLAPVAALLRRLERCGKPVVAAMNGSALGGGYELALACHHRLLLAAPGVQVGLPEVTLGLMPGAGGTQRLPRLISIPKALPLLLEGTRLDPEAALALGLVDGLAASETALLAAAKAYIEGAPAAVQPWDVKGFKVPGGAGPQAPFAAALFQNGTSRLKASRAQYPAARAILSAVYEGTLLPIDLALKVEADHFATLAAGPVAGNLLRLRAEERAARKRAAAGADAQALRRIAVLGAGMMGAGIANVAAGAGIEVRLLDRTRDAAEAGLARITQQRDRALARGGLTAEEHAALLARIRPTADPADLAGADLILEAVFENRAVKAEALAQALPHLAPGGFVASNTSTLPITGLAAALPDPESFIGLHFFSPVERMPLVEVITGARTSPRTLQRALALVARLGKTPIVVRDSPGFYTSRVFCSYIDEAMAMLAEGIAPALIENAARQAGFPVPPLAVTDEVSLDLQKLVLDQAEADGLAPKFLRAHAAAMIAEFNRLGRLGRKSGAGFYDYDAEGGKRLWPGLAALYPARAEQPSAEELGRRLLYIQALESARCLEEGVIADRATADLGSVLGIGYPAWTGGALSVIATVGAAGFIADCADFARRIGPRFADAPALVARVAEGG